MILELHRQGVSVSAIARRVELDRKTVRRYIAKGWSRRPTVRANRGYRSCGPSSPICASGLAAFPQLTGRRLHRELRDLGYSGGYTILTDLLREIRPIEVPPFEVRFETPPGRQAQVDFAHFRTVFTDEPGVERIIWLFSLVLGHSRMLWGRFVLHQDLQTLLRCHTAAFEALGGVPEQILYDRMRTVFNREDPETSHIVYNRTLLAFARHYGYLPKACKAIGPRRRARSSVRSATSARTSSSAGAFATSTISTRSSANGSTRSPMCASMPRPAGCRRTLRRGAPGAAAADRRAVPGRAAARATHHPRRHGLGRRQSLQRAEQHPSARRSKCTAPPTRSAFSRTAPSSPFIPCWTAAVSVASSPDIGRCRHRQTVRPRGDRSGAVRAGEIVTLRPLAFYDAVGKRLAANEAAA